MPAVGAIADVDFAPVGRAHRYQLAACPCGQRRPMGVLLGLRSGARPRLDGQWFCRQLCLKKSLMERARRDFSEREMQPSRMRHRVPLGLILQMRGVVSGPDLQHALRLQAVSGVRLGDLLASHFGVGPQCITEAVAAQWGLPVLHAYAPSARLAGLAPRPLFYAAGCMPVECDENRLLLACAEVPDAGLALALERMYPHLRVEFGVISPTELDRWREQEAQAGVPAQRIPCRNREDAAAQAAALLYRLQPVESRLVRVGRTWWLRLWLEESARAQGTIMQEDTLDVLFAVPHSTPTLS